MDRHKLAKKLATLGHSIEEVGFILLERELDQDEKAGISQQLTWAKELLEELKRR